MAWHRLRRQVEPQGHPLHRQHQCVTQVTSPSGVSRITRWGSPRRRGGRPSCRRRACRGRPPPSCGPLPRRAGSLPSAPERLIWSPSSSPSQLSRSASAMRSRRLSRISTSRCRWEPAVEQRAGPGGRLAVLLCVAELQAIADRDLADGAAFGGEDAGDGAPGVAAGTRIPDFRAGGRGELGVPARVAEFGHHLAQPPGPARDQPVQVRPDHVQTEEGEHPRQELLLPADPAHPGPAPPGDLVQPARAGLLPRCWAGQPAVLPGGAGERLHSVSRPPSPPAPSTRSTSGFKRSSGTATAVSYASACCATSSQRDGPLVMAPSPGPSAVQRRRQGVNAHPVAGPRRGLFAEGPPSDAPLEPLWHANGTRAQMGLDNKQAPGL